MILKLKPFKQNTRIYIFLSLFTLVAGLLIFKDYYMYTEFDIVDQPNDKIISVFNQQINYQIDEHSQSQKYPHYIPESRQNTIDYINSIKSIESYASYHARAKMKYNKIRIKILYNNGRQERNIYTSYSCSGYSSIPCLLMKVEMENGQATKVYTNGQEKKQAPKDIIPEINNILNGAISNYLHKHREKFYLPYPKPKTEEDFAKEWDNL